MLFHIYNRGNRKQAIFNNDLDRIRFLFVLMIFQFNIHLPNIKEILKNVVSIEDLSYILQHWRLQGLKKNRTIKLHVFCLMPNHFHLIIEELKNGACANYMLRALDSYTKFFNIKYDLVGHVFQGSYKSKPITNDEYLLTLSAYIHNNPRNLDLENENLMNFPWSSYPDYIGINRWGTFLETGKIKNAFMNQGYYANFVDNSCNL